ncbi:MAG: prepilin-type N-terminal cleavage/methylation domain-containing protein [Pirellulales bacterium]
MRGHCLPLSSPGELWRRSPFNGRRSRHGISLLEVLISMFVLLFGLLGVASMIVAGRHELAAASKIDHAASVGRAAFRDLKIRGFLDPSRWNTFDEAGNVTTLWQPDPVNHPGRPFLIKGIRLDRFAAVIDPLGLAAPGGSFSRSFPANMSSGLYMVRIAPYPLSNPATTYLVADLAFRSSDDLVFSSNSSNRDLPPTQQMLDGVKRASLGNYSWMATLKTDPSMSALDTLVTVSVAVFYKRNLSNPSAAEGRTTSVVMGGGGNFEFTLPIHPAANKPWTVTPGQWIMLSGTVGTGNHFQWYRVLAADQVHGRTQLVTLAGPDWNPNTTNTTAYLIDNVIAVYEKHMRLELPADAY